ncbi:hypothetical protein HYS28_02055 [Candidatus Uhrbacteria bacterium]|nr:hypothetical protein [Candidatus Uhrbacteria bacterium]
MSHITEGQIAQLRELDDASGEGLREPFQAWLNMVKSGGLVKAGLTIREIQAKRWWDRGVGSRIGFKDFKSYVATIPEIPEHLAADDPTFPYLGLDDPRLGRCLRASLIGVRHQEFGYDDGTLVPFDERHATPTSPYWFRATDGRPNRNRRPSDCRKECVGEILAGTADVGLALCLHYPSAVVQGEHIWDLPGSVRRGGRGYCAYLGVWGDSPELYADGGGVANPVYGSVRFRR